jgi:hypothetical protein
MTKVLSKIYEDKNTIIINENQLWLNWLWIFADPTALVWLWDWVPWVYALVVSTSSVWFINQSWVWTDTWVSAIQNMIQAIYDPWYWARQVAFADQVLNLWYYALDTDLPLTWIAWNYAVVWSTDTIWVWDTTTSTWLNSWSGSTWDMVKANYDPANWNKQVAFSDEVYKDFWLKSFYYNNISSKYNIISWIQVDAADSIRWWDMITDWTYCFYTTMSETLVRLTISTWTKLTIATSVNSWSWFQIDSTHAFFRNSSNNFIYKVLFDWTWLTQITTANSYCHTLSSTVSTIIIYINITDSNKLYKINKDWTWNTKLSDTILPLTWTVWYIIWSNSIIFIDVNNDIRKIGYDWTWESVVYAWTVEWITCLWDLIWFHQSGWLYFINIDTTWLLKLTTDNVVANIQYSPTTQEIIYSKYAWSWLKAIKIDTLVVRELSTFWSLWFPKYSIYWWYIYYIPEDKKIYKLNIANPVWYSLTDWTITYSWISNYNSSQYITIDTKNTLPAWTNYTFELWNNNTSAVIVAEWDGSNMVYSNHYDSFSADLNALFNPWDVVILYKTWQSDITWLIIDSIGWMWMTFTTNTWIWFESWWGIKTWSINYELIPDSSLNWNVLIDCVSLFWTIRDYFYIRIILTPVDNIIVPEINVIEIKWS